MLLERPNTFSECHTSVVKWFKDKKLFETDKVTVKVREAMHSLMCVSWEQASSI